MAKTTKKEAKDAIPSLVRLPIPLHKALKRAIETSRRSLHGEILYRLEMSLGGSDDLAVKSQKY